MPSPQCTVNNSSTQTEVSVTASSSVTIALQDPTGVNAWSLVCIATDVQHNASTINSGLSINVLTKQATFSAPAGASALIFRSTVNQGLNQNNELDPALVSEFMVHVPTANGFLTVATGELGQANAINGWTGKLDSVIRSAIILPSGLADGDLLYVSNGKLVRLPIGTSGQVLKVVSGLPAWVTP